jgi:hypothetical protein
MVLKCCQTSMFHNETITCGEIYVQQPLLIQSYITLLYKRPKLTSSHFEQQDRIYTSNHCLQKQRSAAHQSDPNQGMGSASEELVSSMRVEHPRREHNVSRSSKRRRVDGKDEIPPRHFQTLKDASDLQPTEQIPLEQRRTECSIDDPLLSTADSKYDMRILPDSTYRPPMKTAGVPDHNVVRASNRDLETRSFRGVHPDIKPRRPVLVKGAKNHFQRRQTPQRISDRLRGDDRTTVPDSLEDSSMIPESAPSIESRDGGMNIYEGSKSTGSPSCVAKTTQSLIEQTRSKYDTRIVVAQYRLLVVTVPIWLITSWMLRTTSHIPRYLVFSITWLVWAFLTGKD